MSTAQPQPVVPSSFGIVVGLDFTDAGGFAFGQAARIARRISGSQLHLVHVFEESPNEAAASALLGRLRTYVNEKAAFVGGLRGVTVGIHLRNGTPAVELVRLASEVAADLMIVGAHKGPSMKSWLVGTVAENLVEFAPCPVLVAGPKPAVHESTAPTIEPVCPDCVDTRASSHGTRWWCDRHHAHARKVHLFSYARELPFETHDSEVIPTGIDLS